MSNFHCQVGGIGVIFLRRLCQIGKGLLYFHGVVCDVSNSIPRLAGGFMAFTQVYLRLDEMFLEVNPDLVVLQLEPPGSAVFLELPCFCNRAICD